MADQSEKARQFSELHKKGDPVILYTVWDGGSAKAVAGAGAKVIAVGDHPVGFSHGYSNDDFGEFTFENYLGTVKDIIRVIDVPFTVDISNGEGLDLDALQQRVRILLELGVVGVNFEDRLDDDSGIKPVDEQTDRIKAIRAAADEYGVPLFINARTDLFSTESDKSKHAGLLDEAVERSKAYEAAGGNGFFAPVLMDIDLITQLCERSTLPVNIIRLPGAPSTAELKAAGVSRISYGPIVQMEMIDWLKKKAEEALSGSV